MCFLMQSYYKIFIYCGCFRNWMLIPGILSSNRTGHYLIGTFKFIDTWTMNFRIAWLGELVRMTSLFFFRSPKSPDFTYCDFFVWVHIRSLFPSMKNIREAQVPDECCSDNHWQNVWKEFNYHLDLCRVTHGAYV